MAVHTLTIESEALKGNPLGDPHVRKLHVIVPDDLPDEPVPCVWWLAGYAGVGRAMLGDDPWQEGLEERLIRLRKEGKIGPMIVALPDAFTRLGGCQYLSSPAVGDYETYLFEELRAAVQAKWPVSRHGIAGKSSGGYGAIIHGMKRPELFDAVVCHSGDMGFEMSLIPDIPQLMNAVRDHGSVQALADAHVRTTKKKAGRWFGPLSMLALASVYSPKASAEMGIDVPFDLEQGTLRRDVIERWLAWDPLNMIGDPAHQAGLAKMRLVFIDCGKNDEHHLHWGALQMHRKLQAARVTHRYEDFDGGHRSTSHRLDVSFPALWDALS